MINPYLGPMEPWPALKRYARRVVATRDRIQLFVYDTNPDGDDTQANAVLIHGLGDEADTWRHLVEPLAPTRRVIALDLPGFGRSDKPRRAYHLWFFRDVIVALLDALKIQSVQLVGHSLGGMIAHAVALEHPERVRELMLIDGALPVAKQKFSLTTLMGLLPIIGERSYNGLRGSADASYDSLAAYYADITKLPDADRKFLYQRVNERVWSDAQRDAYFSVWRQLPLWMLRHQHEAITRIRRLTIPTTIVWGQEDKIVPLASGQALVSIQPASRLVIIPHSGHMPQQEQPEAVLKLFVQAR